MPATFAATSMPDFVEQRHRPHRHAEVDHGLVERLDGVAFLEQEAGLVHVRPEDAVDDEAGAVVAVDDGLAELARESGDGDHGHVRGLLAADDLDERHAVDGIEEVHPDDVLGMLRPRRRCCVMGMVDVFVAKMAPGFRDRFELGQHLALDVDVLDDRLDDDVGALRSRSSRWCAVMRASLRCISPRVMRRRSTLLLPDLRGRLHAAGDAPSS